MPQPSHSHSHSNACMHGPRLPRDCRPRDSPCEPCVWALARSSPRRHALGFGWRDRRHGRRHGPCAPSSLPGLRSHCLLAHRIVPCLIPKLTRRRTLCEVADFVGRPPRNALLTARPLLEDAGGLGDGLRGRLERASVRRRLRLVEAVQLRSQRGKLDLVLVELQLSQAEHLVQLDDLRFGLRGATQAVAGSARLVLNEQQPHRLPTRQPSRIRAHLECDRLACLARASSPESELKRLARLPREWIVRRHGEGCFHLVGDTLLRGLRNEVLHKVPLQHRVAPQAGDLNGRGIPAGHMPMRVDRAHKRRSRF
mmetsp:Transcript_11260/g.28803  ORF Transcript_11260/g.28803 Transcript_11260/m.28803 type:complete len:311 (-) Transcript_11260:421-1353(-)